MNDEINCSKAAKYFASCICSDIHGTKMKNLDNNFGTAITITPHRRNSHEIKSDE